MPESKDRRGGKIMTGMRALFIAALMADFALCQAQLDPNIILRGKTPSDYQKENDAHNKNAADVENLRLRNLQLQQQIQQEKDASAKVNQQRTTPEHPNVNADSCLASCPAFHRRAKQPPRQFVPGWLKTHLQERQR